MKECYELTKDAFRGSRVCWVRKISPSFNNIARHLKNYRKAVVDVNLDISRPETEEGLEVIKRLRGYSDTLPIICISSENKKEKSLEAGANKFIFKKQFWSREDGRQKR